MLTSLSWLSVLKWQNYDDWGLKLLTNCPASRFHNTSAVSLTHIFTFGRQHSDIYIDMMLLSSACFPGSKVCLWSGHRPIYRGNTQQLSERQWVKKLDYQCDICVCQTFFALVSLLYWAQSAETVVVLHCHLLVESSTFQVDKWSAAAFVWLEYQRTHALMFTFYMNRCVYPRER